jgi:hypothetical protein
MQVAIEELNLNPPVSAVVIYVSRPDSTQNHTPVTDTLRLLSDF